MGYAILGRINGSEGGGKSQSPLRTVWDEWVRVVALMMPCELGLCWEQGGPHSKVGFQGHVAIDPRATGLHTT